MSLPDSVVRSIVGRMIRQRGENAEQRVVRIFKLDGWKVGRIRQGPIDIIAGKDGRVILVQVKSGRARVKRTELARIIDWAKAFNADTEVWHLRGTKVERRRVYAVKPAPEASDQAFRK